MSGEPRAIYFDRLESSGELAVSFYDLRHAIKCYQNMHQYLATADRERHIHVTYLSYAQISELYNMSSSELIQPAILVTMHSMRVLLDSLNYSALFQSYGDVFLYSIVEKSFCKVVIRVEFYDERTVGLVKAHLNNKTLQDVTFEVASIPDQKDIPHPLSTQSTGPFTLGPKNDNMGLVSPLPALRHPLYPILQLAFLK
ncbi:hypothetical protein CLU79DRAFT_885644 [Phycomyces nitens]|nr:hypothetical protein CLU79DRAFT_885644 [Phycomyces nitens]